ncbi:MAG: helix-turn-helix transcriptional regulator [Pseudonocardiaceae bacterium]
MTGLQQAAAAVIAALHHPMRAKLYGFIRRERRPVTREHAAAAIGISSKLAAFHLGQLVDVGLLHANDLITPGRRSPGRAPKAYTLAPGEWQISLPERRYALLAEILICAVLTSQPSEPARQAAMRAATETGRQLGEHARAERRLGRLGPERALTAAAEVLEDYGYEPDRATGCIVLRNCPFAQFATSVPELVCTLNQHLIAGLLTGLGAAQRLHAALIPTSLGCCIQVHTDHLATPSPTTG